MKKLFAFLLLVSLTLSLALPAVALDPTDDLIVDETGSISRHDLGSLNDLALTASEKCGIEIMFLLTDKADDNEIADYAEEAPMGGSGHSVLLAVNETFWYIRSRGDAAVITDDEEEILFEKFADGSGYVDGIEEYIAEPRIILFSFTKVIPPIRQKPTRRAMKAPKPSRRASWTMPVFSPVRKSALSPPSSAKSAQGRNSMS